MPRANRKRDNFRADYTYEIEGNVIAIVDLDKGNRSVTNDIENIIEDLKEGLNSNLSGYAIIYKDSMGIWDGVRITPKGNIDFYRLNEADQAKATARLLHLVP